MALTAHTAVSLRWLDAGCKVEDGGRWVCRQASTSYGCGECWSWGGVWWRRRGGYRTMASGRSEDGKRNYDGDGISKSRGKENGWRRHTVAGSSRFRVSASAIGGREFEAWNSLAPPEQQYPRLQDMDPSSMLLKQRMIFLGSQVDDLSADAIISQMLLLDAQDPTQDIKLLINSPGGSVTAGMGIYDAMKLCRADISTICFGLAASMGAFLLSAGSKGKRYCMPNARVMIHQPLGGAGGSAIDVGLQVREMMYHKVKLTKIMARLTGKTEEQIEVDTDRDYFMNAWEAVEYGLVDHVVDDGKPGLVAPIGEVKEPPKSQVWSYWGIKERKERKNLPTEAPPVTKEDGDVRKEKTTTV